MNNEILRSDIYEVMKTAVFGGFLKVKELEKNGEYIGRYSNFPKMEWFDSGFPHFSKTFFDEGPKDFSNAFRNEIEPQFESWKIFWDLALTDTYLSSYWKVRDSDKSEKDFIRHPQFFELYKEIQIYGPIKNLVDRYIHMNGLESFDEHNFIQIYQEWERAQFLENLPFNIVVPIICQSFSFDSYRISSNVLIQRMDANFQKARSKGKYYNVSVHDTVIGAATHALVLERWTVKNKSLEERTAIFYEVSAFAEAFETIDIFFAALRSVTGVETGYSQILASPLGWADNWEAYLPNVYNAVAIRAYPDFFENYGWLRVSSEIDEKKCEDVQLLFTSLLTTPHNKLKLSAKRLNAAFLRKSEEDSILDVTIGLEALLAGSSRSEVTHKLSMRAAAICKINHFPKLNPNEVFKACKKIYDYRSAVVHGSKKPESRRIIQIEDSIDIPAILLGIDLLRHIIVTLVKYPDYLDSQKLDLILLE